MKKKLILITVILNIAAYVNVQAALTQKSMGTQTGPSQHVYADESVLTHVLEFSSKDFKNALDLFFATHEDDDEVPSIEQLQGLLDTLNAETFKTVTVELYPAEQFADVILQKHEVLNPETDTRVPLTLESTVLLLQALHMLKKRSGSTETHATQVNAGQEIATQTEPQAQAQKSPAVQPQTAANPQPTAAQQQAGAQAAKEKEDEEKKKKEKDKKITAPYYIPQQQEQQNKEQKNNKPKSGTQQLQPQNQPVRPHPMMHPGYKHPMMSQQKPTGAVGGSIYDKTGFTVAKPVPKGKDATRQEVEALVPEGTVQVTMAENTDHETTTLQPKRITANPQTLDHKRKTERTSRLKIKDSKPEEKTKIEQKEPTKTTARGMVQRVYHSVSSFFSWLWSKITGK